MSVSDPVESDPTAGSASAETSGQSRPFRIAFVRNHWYVAAPASALRNKPLATTILGEPIVLFRADGGKPAALLDRCAHRNVPLSLGRVENCRIACGYHGWEFDGTGTCRRVPALVGEAEGPARRVRAFPCVERDGFVWVFVGDEDRQPDSEPFAFPHMNDASYGKFRVDYEVDATLHATLENMLDVPHTAFLHRGLFRGGDPNEIRAVVTREPDRVVCRYRDEPVPSGLAAKILGIGSGDDGGEVEHYDRFLLPSISQVEYRIGRSHLVASSALTPVGDFKTRFSTVIAYKLPLPRLALRALFEPVARRILAQDAAMIAEQTAAVRRFGGEDYVSTQVDVLGPEIWRMLKAAEQGGPMPTPSEHTVHLSV